MGNTRAPDGMVRLALGVVSTALALGVAGATRGGAAPVALGRRSSRSGRHGRSAVSPAPAPTPVEAAVAARRLNRAAGTLAASVLLDSAVEHYRGGFRNRAMYIPLITSSLALAISAHGTVDPHQAPHPVRNAIYLATALVGLIGTGFHLRNLSKRPGKMAWQNLFYGAPLGAPAAIGLSGLFGFLSERIRDTPEGQRPVIAGLPAGRIVGLSTAAGLMGTTSEAWLLHFRGSFHNPLMYLPVTMPPMASVIIAFAGMGETRTPRPVARWWLRATTLLGLAGTAFHVVGVGRDMEGWRNWQQNILNGPPIPAPPAFTGLALAGLAALSLLEDHPNA